MGPGHLILLLPGSSEWGSIGVHGPFRAELLETFEPWYPESPIPLIKEYTLSYKGLHIMV